jgi:hypothetical protein
MERMAGEVGQLFAKLPDFTDVSTTYLEVAATA